MDELISDFLAETAEGLSVLDLELVRLEQDPNDQEILGNIFRVMHTIKGTCGFLGLPRLEAVAHAGENILGKIRDGELAVTPEIISNVLKAIDAIKAIMAHIEETEAEPEGDDKELINILNQCAESSGGAPPTAPMTNDDDILSMANAGEPSAEIDDALSDVENNTEDESVAANDDVQPATPVEEPAEKVAVEEGLKAPVKEKTASKSTANQSIRVSLDVLENLMQMVSELVLTRNQLLQLLRSAEGSPFTTSLQRLNHITSELQERVMKTRMQPISNAWTPFPRLVRDLSLDMGKKIELIQIGADTELDRQLLEFIKDPLTHMVRNSCDHGIDMPEDRITQGKPEMGTITLKAYHEGGHIIVEICDDGRGMSSEKIGQKALSKGIITEKELAAMSEQQILQFIFKAGFSTAEQVTSVSGRGVGMDVVKTNIEKISGSIELKSSEGVGSTFKIKIPLTLAIMPVLIVETQKQLFAIPQSNVVEMVKIGERSEHQMENINGAPLLRLRGNLLPLIPLAKTLQLSSDITSQEKNFVVVCELGGFHFGVIVDHVFDTEEIVVKPVADVLQNIDVYSGCTILGDGSVTMILDPNGLLKTAGDISAITENQIDNKHDDATLQEKTRFLQFRTQSETPKTVPLELVSRLEEINAEDIEYTNNGPILQYRGDLIFLSGMDPDMELPKEGIMQVIVFSDYNKTLGMVVEEILDIVEDYVGVTAKSGQDGYLGSIVIGEKTYDLIDVGYFFKQRFPDLRDTSSGRTETKAPPRILFVDDSPFFRKFIPPALTKAGFAVTTAESAENALSVLAKDSRYAAIVTDMNMPGMNGAEFAKQCKNDNSLSSIPVVALSSQSSEQLKSYEDALLLNGYVSKTNHGELLATITDLLTNNTEDVA